MLRGWGAPWEVLRSPLMLFRSKGVKGCPGGLVGGGAVVGEAGWGPRPESRMSADEKAGGLTGVRWGAQVTLSGPGAGAGPVRGRGCCLATEGWEEPGCRALQEPGVDTGCHPQGAARAEGTGLAAAPGT